MATERWLIDAKPLMKNGWHLVQTGESNRFLRSMSLADVPPVDAVEVVHGRWETDKEDIEWGNSLKRKHCTNCGKRPHYDKEKREFVLSDYCPNCGAKMEG